MELYKIGKLTKVLNLTPRTIRYYDSFGLLPNAKRSDGQTRLFDDNDIAVLKAIKKHKRKMGNGLDAIRNVMFPENFNHKNALFITDNISNQTLSFSDNCNVITINSKGSAAQQVKEFNQKFLDEISSAEYIFCFYEGNNHYLYENLKVAKKQHVFFYKCAQMGMSYRLITDYVTQNINNYKNLVEFDRVINRMINLSFNICIYDTLDRFLEKNNQDNVKFSTMIAEFSPIILSSLHSNEILSFQDDFFDVLSLIAEYVDEELFKRKRYCETACIYHYNAEKLAKAVKEHIVELCPNLMIDIKEIKSTTQIQNNGICISVA